MAYVIGATPIAEYWEALANSTATMNQQQIGTLPPKAPKEPVMLNRHERRKAAALARRKKKDE